MPPPLPRSRTVSPGSSEARAVGLPHPSEALTAASGITATSSVPYRLPVIGLASESQQAVVSLQQPLVGWASATARARAAYFSRTVARTESSEASADIRPSYIDGGLSHRATNGAAVRRRTLTLG